MVTLTIMATAPTTPTTAATTAATTATTTATTTAATTATTTATTTAATTAVTTDDDFPYHYAPTTGLKAKSLSVNLILNRRTSNNKFTL